MLAVAVIPAAAQNPTVQFTNITRPASKNFQIGDRFEIVIQGAPDQPVSVRTTMQLRTDWGPVIGQTDKRGRWSASGQFVKTDFGDWSEFWTVGHKLAAPALHFFVGAPCLPQGLGAVIVLSVSQLLNCETADGPQTFSTPSDPDPFRTPDGRVVPGRKLANRTHEQYHMQILENLITAPRADLRSPKYGDHAAALITKLIGVNALSEDETEKVLLIIHATFERRAEDRSRTLDFLRSLADSTDQESLKQKIADTIAYVEAR